MGTNFYLANKEMWELTQKYPEYEFNIYDKEGQDVLRLHIGKLSSGWKFLFESCKYFDSFETLKNFYLQNMDKYVIINDSNEICDGKDFFSMLIKRAREGKAHTDSEKYTEKDVYAEFYTDSQGYEWCRSQFS